MFKIQSISELKTVLDKMRDGEDFSIRHCFLASVPFMGTRTYKHTPSSVSITWDTYRHQATHKQAVTCLEKKIAEYDRLGINHLKDDEYFEVSSVRRNS